MQPTPGAVNAESYFVFGNIQISPDILSLFQVSCFLVRTCKSIGKGKYLCAKDFWYHVKKERTTTYFSHKIGLDVGDIGWDGPLHILLLSRLLECRYILKPEVVEKRAEGTSEGGYVTFSWGM